MAGNGEEAPSSPGQGRQRRTSFAEMFSNRRPSIEQSKSSRSAISSAMQQAQEQSKNRRLSITTQLGLSGSSPNGNGQPSPFSAMASRARSQSEVSPVASEADEQAIDDTDTVPRSMMGNSDRNGSPSLSRSISQGARAYGEMRASISGGSTGGSPPSGTPPGGKSSTPPGARKEGFNFSDSLRTRAERSSISVAGGTSPGAGPGFFNGHRRTTSTGFGGDSMPPPAPAPKPVPKAPDHFQERILKGDFYMD